jgi:predicted metal-binding membrane protein
MTSDAGARDGAPPSRAPSRARPAAAAPAAAPAARRRLGGVPAAHLAVPGVALVTLAALAWLLTARQARGMTTEPGTMGMSVPAFLAMWTAMMAAMMFQSVATVAVGWVRSITARSAGWVRGARIAGFLGGYLLAWAAYGLAAYGLLAGAERLVDRSPDGARWAGAAIFAVAGVYQLTPLKDVCLTHCRSPLGQLLHYGRYRGPLRDLRVGLHHGAYCVACCWSLMLVLVAVGVMNVAVMAALAAVIFVEKLWRFGRYAAKAAGVALVLLAVLVPAYPGLAPALQPREPMRMDMPMDMRMPM